MEDDYEFIDQDIDWGLDEIDDDYGDGEYIDLSSEEDNGFIDLDDDFGEED